MQFTPDAAPAYPPVPLDSMSIRSMSTGHHSPPHPRRVAFGASFFLEGLLNNVLYVVILSAALDLVNSAETPKVRHQ